MSVSSAGDSGVNKTTIGWIQWSHWLPPGRMSLCSDIISCRGGGVLVQCAHLSSTRKFYTAVPVHIPLEDAKKGKSSFCLARGLRVLQGTIINAATTTTTLEHAGVSSLQLPGSLRSSIFTAAPLIHFNLKQRMFIERVTHSCLKMMYMSSSCAF